MKDYLIKHKGTILYWIVVAVILIGCVIIFNPRYRDIQSKLPISTNDTLSYTQTKQLANKIEVLDRIYNDCLKTMQDMLFSYEGLAVDQWKDADKKEYNTLAIKLKDIETNYNSLIYLYNKTINDVYQSYNSLNNKAIEDSTSLPIYFNYK